jgi:hypothetical protein
MSELIRVNQPSVIFDEAEGVVVIINLVSGHYFRLGDGTSTLWNLLTVGCTFESLAQSCRNPDDLVRDWPGIRDELIKHELVTLEAAGDTPQLSLPAWDYRQFSIEPFTDLEDILGLDPIHEVDPVRGWPHARES